MSDLTIQGEVQISAEGAESALDRVADKAGEMARRMQVEGDKAGKAVDGIGAGADKNADQFTRAEGRLSESIKRATKNLQELGKTASQKIELRIAEKNLDASKFEPMLAKLRELEAAQVRVATSSPRMGTGLQNTSYQLQDFIVQVNGGTDATRALSMQLPQMLIGFGALGAGIGVVAALLPNLISAFGGTGESTKKFSDAMSDFGTAIGDVGTTVKTFDLDPLYKQFNDSSAAVRAATIEQIKFQQEYIKTTQLVAQKKFDESVGDLGGYGTLDKLAGAFGNTSAEKLAKQLGLQLAVAQELLPVLRGLNKGTEDIGLAFEKAGQKLLGGNQRAVDLAKSLADVAKTERDAAAASSALIAAQEKMAAAGSKGAIAVKERTKAVKEEVDALSGLLATLNAKDSGFDQNYVKNVETLLVAFDKGKLSLGEFNAVFARYVAMQPGAVAAEKERTAALQEAWKLDVQRTDALAKETDALDRQLEKAREENALIGLTKAETDALKLARIDDAIAIKQQQLALAEKHSDSATEIELIRDQVNALQELRAVTASSQVKQANADSIKDQTKAWQKFSDDIERSLTDALMRSFEAGDDFGKAFAKSLENTFKTMVLKFAVQAVVDPVMGTVQSMAGGSSGMSGSSLFSSANSMYNATQGGGMYGSFATSSIGANLGLSTAVTSTPEAFLAGAANFTTELTTLGSAIGTLLPWAAAALVAVQLISSQLTGGTPHKGGAAFSDSNTDFNANAGRAATSSFFGNDSFQGTDWWKSPAISEALTPVAAGFADTLNSVRNRYGLGDAKVGIGFSADGEDKSRGVARAYDDAGNALLMYYERFDEDATKGMQQFSSHLSEMMITALAASDLSDPINTYLDKFAGTISEAAGNAVAAALDSAWIDPFIEQIDVAALSFDEITAALVRFSEIATLKPLFDALSLDIYQFGNDIAAAFGGAENAASAMSAYYDAFYSDAEKTANLTEQMAGQFDDLNLTMPDTRDGFRALVESLDLTTASGQSAYAALIGMAPAFATLTEAANAAADATIDSARRTAERAAELNTDARLAINQAAIEGTTVVLTEEQMRRLETRAVEKLVKRESAYESLKIGRDITDSIGRFMLSFDRPITGLRALSRRMADDALGISDVGGAYAALDNAAIPRNGQRYDPAWLAGMYGSRGISRVSDRDAAVQAAIDALDETTTDYWRQVGLLMRQKINVGLHPIETYFGDLGAMADKLADAAREAAEPIAQLADTIGRMKSLAFVFGAAGSTSSSSRLNLTNTDAARAIAAAAADAATWLNTQGGTALAAEYGADARFAGIDWQAIGPMLDIVTAFSVAGYDAAFVRLSDALADGSLNVEQYNLLMGEAKDAFLGLSESVDAAGGAIGSLVSLLDGAVGTLESQRQYDLIDKQAALAQVGSALAIAQAGGGLPSAESISDAVKILQADSKALYATAAEYETDFYLAKNTMSELRDYASAHPDATVSDVVAELQTLRQEVIMLRAEMQATALSTNTTARILNRVTKDGESLTTSPLV